MPRAPSIARTAESLSDRVFSRLVAKAARMPGLVHPLHVGDTYLDPLPAAQAGAQRAEDHPRLHNYAPVQGEPALLDAICAHLEARGGCLIDRECVQVTSGATSGLGVVVDALVSPGEEVLLPSPYWPLIRGIVHKRGATPVQVPFFDRLADPSFDAEAALEDAVTDRTVAVYVNTPHNPTGAVLPDPVLAAIAAVAERHDLWVLSDEVYEEVYFGSLPPKPVWARSDFQTRTVAVHSMSKGYGLAGSRVGWAHGPFEAMQAVRGVQTFSTYCAPKPLQLGAAAALRGGGEWLARARAGYERAGGSVAEALSIAPPQGGTFLFVDIRPYRRPGEDTLGFLERCLDAGVLLTPGVACGRDYEGWIRLCYTSVPPPELADAVERIRPLFSRAGGPVRA
ncbi:MAG: pyridoxal phosphate-dependent aminotransferase [Sandaracinaceae bacterium]